MYNVVGKPVLRSDAKEKSLGTAVYAADINFTNMLQAKVLRSKIPHGIVKSIDTSAAEALEGIEVVVTRADIPGDNSYGIVLKDEPVFVGIGERIRKVGDPIAAVAAETVELAEKAISLIKVEIEELKPLKTIQDAMDPDAPQLHARGNVVGAARINKGNAEEAFTKCDYVVEAEYQTHMQDHAAIEPDAGVAKYEGDVMTIWCSTQNVHYDQRDIARILNIPLHRTRIIQAVTGGGFGGKLDVSVQAQLCILASKTRRPVKLVMTREEYLFATPKRHPYFMKVKTGMTKDGNIIAHKGEIYGDTGAYTSYGPAVLTRGSTHCCGPYEVDNITNLSYAVYTNNPTCGAFRGFGVPQMTFAFESQIEKLSKASGIPSYEIRHKNAYRNGAVTPTGQQLSSGVGIIETLEKAKAKAEEVLKKPENLPSSKKYGKGIACMKYGCGNTGLPNPAGAFVEWYQDGTALVFCGCADIGQGSDTVLGQIAAEALGVFSDDVKVISADTGRTPDAGATSASRQTFISGNAVRLAAEEARIEVAKVAAEQFKVSAEEIVFANRKIYPKGRENEAVTVNSVLEACRAKGILTQGSGWFNPDTTGLDGQTGFGRPYEQFSFATQIADVIVDTDTGEIEVLNVVAAHDVGQAINPANVEGQIEGGIGIGFGYGTSENMIVKDSVLQTYNFSTYVIPSNMDMPKIHSIIVECPDPSGPYGAKGVGEASLIPTATAIANAVFDATGVQIESLPVTPEKVLAGLKAQAKA